MISDLLLKPCRGFNRSQEESISTSNQTSAIKSDPTGGQPNLLYYDSIMQDLSDENFHPAGMGSDADDSMKLRPLSDQEWSNLTPIGTLRVPQLVFARGTSTLLERSRNTLDDLADTLRTQQYYLQIRGVATRKGNQELNKSLAASRAEAAAEYLISHGIDANRIRASEPKLDNVPSVTFTLGQLPY